MNLRLHYLNENGEAVTHDYWIPQSDLRHHLDRTGELVGTGGMIHHHNASDYLFSVPASRILKIEAMT